MITSILFSAIEECSVNYIKKHCQITKLLMPAFAEDLVSYAIKETCTGLTPQREDSQEDYEENILSNASFNAIIINLPTLFCSLFVTALINNKIIRIYF